MTLSAEQFHASMRKIRAAGEKLALQEAHAEACLEKIKKKSSAVDTACFDKICEMKEAIVAHDSSTGNPFFDYAIVSRTTELRRSAAASEELVRTLSTLDHILRAHIGQPLFVRHSRALYLERVCIGIIQGGLIFDYGSRREESGMYMDYRCFLDIGESGIICSYEAKDFGETVPKEIADVSGNPWIDGYNPGNILDDRLDFSSTLRALEQRSSQKRIDPTEAYPQCLFENYVDICIGPKVTEQIHGLEKGLANRILQALGTPLVPA